MSGCEPALAVPVLYPGEVKSKPLFEMGVANFFVQLFRFAVVPQSGIT